MQFNFENIKKNIKKIVVVKAIQGQVMLSSTADAPATKEPFLSKENTIEHVETAQIPKEAAPLDLSNKS